MCGNVFKKNTFLPLDRIARILYNARMQYINLRVRKETQHKLKILSALLDEKMLDTLDRLITQELDRVQKGEKHATVQENQARSE